MSDTYEKQVFAENLRGVLEATGCSQQQLAEVLGVSEASVSLWLSATHYPTRRQLSKVHKRKTP